MRCRELEELALDEVYRGYVLLKYQASVAAVAAEAAARQEAEQRADSATARQEAEQRADSEAAARREAEARTQAMEAELDRLRRQSS